MAKKQTGVQGVGIPLIPEMKPCDAMAAVKCGDVVRWYHNGDSNVQPAAAIVVEKGNHTIDLLVFQPGYQTGVLVSACRHVNDEYAVKEDRLSTGGWDFNPDQIEMSRLSTLVRELNEKVDKMYMKRLEDGKRKATVDKRLMSLGSIVDRLASQSPVKGG